MEQEKVDVLQGKEKVMTPSEVLRYCHKLSKMFVIKTCDDPRRSSAIRSYDSIFAFLIGQIQISRGKKQTSDTKIKLYWETGNHYKRKEVYLLKTLKSSQYCTWSTLYTRTEKQEQNQETSELSETAKSEFQTKVREAKIQVNSSR